MARTLCTDVPRISLMTAAACWVLLAPTAWAQLGAMALGAAVGMWLFKPSATDSPDALPIAVSRRTGAAWLTVFAVLLVGLPLAVSLWPSPALAMVDAFYRAGSLVFGGGHVVLPLLQTEVVANGWVTHDTFLAGYGATQAVPGPLFTFAAFLGASMNQGPTGWAGGLLCLVAVFVPSFLLVAGALPFWAQWRRHARMQAALAGINAVVVGLLLAALYQPVWTGAVHSPQDVALALVALVALMHWKLPPWLVVAGCAVLGGLMGALTGSALAP
jgi:chromate transporter